ncbi:SOS response-associated peptidase [Bacillus salitolerans]|uniref:Abasic site processing protein n=1 Tax=Bacillus salitolerans TaxID=1437434 RepID=A0ABW4LUQ7_9BACI
MCGRFTLTAKLEELMERFQFQNDIQEEYEISYNISPSQSVLAVVNDGISNRAGYIRWGLVPSFAKDEKIGQSMINARAETLHEKPSFKRLLTRRRCIIVADSFFEWKRTNGNKHPMRFTLDHDQPFALAGLWDRWQTENKTLVTCTVITTKPNRLVEGVHDRMPVILSKEAEQLWLNPSEKDETRLLSVLTSFPESKMNVYEVSSIVNSPKNNIPSCIEAI